jgi:hypothetical protein
MMNSQANAREVRPSPHVVARTVGEQAVLVHLQTNRIYELNATGSRIWELVEAGADDAEVMQRLGAEFAVSPEVAQRDFEALVADLVREGLLEPAA